MRAYCLTLMGLVILTAGSRALAADYLGAEAALKQAQRQAAPESNPVGQLRAELEQFKEKSSAKAGMPAAEAARTWLAFADRSLAMDVNALAQRGQLTEQPQFQEVVGALPPPSAWDALAAAIQARAPAPERRDLLDEAWLMWAHLLKGDSAARWSGVLRMRSLLSKAPAQQKAMLVAQFPALVQAVAAASNDPDRVVQAFELQLSLRGGGQEMGYLEVPDLVRLVGPQKAEPILRRVLTTSTHMLYFSEKNGTRTLARKLATELLPQLRAPQWYLAASLDGAPLYEALQKRFPAVPPAPRRGGRFNGGMDYQAQQSAQARMTARTYYMLNRATSGRMAEAVAMAPALRTQSDGRYTDPTPFYEVVRGGQRKELLQFFHAVLEKWPDLPLWQSYSQFALEGGQGEAVTQLCRQVLPRKGITPATAAQIRERLVDALLALNRPDDAAAELRVLMRAPSNPEGGQDPASHAVRLARLGRVLKKPEWVAEGLRMALAHGDDGESITIDGHLGELAPILQEVGRGPEAEKLLIASLARQAQNDRVQMGMGMGGDGQTLMLLMELYHRAGRHADVLMLLRKAPYWGAEDLSEIMLQAGEEDLPVGYMAAAALADAGQKVDASRTLRALLLHRVDFDPGYELLAKLDGPAALPFLEQAFQRDPFEERPLIWKAYILLNAGRLEEAEKAARAAISIDPSDGEQQHGRRMRVYAVLADILQARGDMAQASLYLGVTRAIRMSEEADRLVEAGLTQRGIQLYNDSLGQFADAYCIQSRLAVRLAEQGRLQEAEAHFKRAFELMPSSFGRVETHCLGCEGVFTSKQAQAIAEKVFTELMARNPERAQVHYLMGYLREQQGRYPEAQKLFQEAVRRDPDYLNAWKHLQALGASIRFTPADQNQITVNLVRLDPLGRHETGQARFAGDLRALWTAAERAAGSHPQPRDEKLMPLTESAKTLQTVLAQHPEFAMQRAQMRQQRMMSRGMGEWSWNGMEAMGRNATPTPGEMVATHPEVQVLTQIMDALRGARAQVVQ